MNKKQHMNSYCLIEQYVTRKIRWTVFNYKPSWHKQQMMQEICWTLLFQQYVQHSLFLDKNDKSVEVFIPVYYKT